MTAKGTTDTNALAQARAELAFVVARATARTRRKSGSWRCWGLSSDGLATFAIGGPEPRHAPADPSDLLACELTYQMAPAHLRPAMDPWLEKWRGDVFSRYPEAEAKIAEILETYKGGTTRVV